MGSGVMYPDKIQLKNLKSKKGLVNLPKPIKLENGEAGIWIEVLRDQSHA